MTPLIGIDFGTTNSVVAVLGEDGAVRTRRFPSAAGPLDVVRSVLCFWTGGPGADGAQTSTSSGRTT